jgi:hypothetical protein
VGGLPPGSSITFVHARRSDDTVAPLLKRMPLQRVVVAHVQADPLRRSTIMALDLSQVGQRHVEARGPRGRAGWVQGGKAA